MMYLLSLANIRPFPSLLAHAPVPPLAHTASQELLLEAMTERAAQPMLQSGRSQLGYGDVAQAVSSWQSLDFLGDVIPHKIPAGVVLQKMLAAKAAAAVA